MGTFPKLTNKKISFKTLPTRLKEKYIYFIRYKKTFTTVIQCEKVFEADGDVTGQGKGKFKE